MGSKLRSLGRRGRGQVKEEAGFLEESAVRGRLISMKISLKSEYHRNSLDMLDNGTKTKETKLWKAIH